MEAESIRSRVESTGGWVKLKTATEVRWSSMLLLLITFIQCYSLLYSRLTALLSHVIPNEWLAFHSAFWISTEVVYVQRCYMVSWYIYSREYLFCRMYSILCGIGSQWRAWNRKVIWSVWGFLGMRQIAPGWLGVKIIFFKDTCKQHSSECEEGYWQGKLARPEGIKLQ